MIWTNVVKVNSMLATLIHYFFSDTDRYSINLLFVCVWVKVLQHRRLHGLT